MAGGTKCHEVHFIVRAALGQRDDMMHFLRWGDPATILAPLAQRVGSDEAVTHALPHPTVTFLHSRVTLVAFVPLGFLFGVFLAEATVGQPWTAGVGAGTLGSAGHWGHLRGHRKERVSRPLYCPTSYYAHFPTLFNSHLLSLTLIYYHLFGRV